VPSEVSDYVRPVRRLAIRLFKRNGQTAHALLISTLEPSDVMALQGRPQHDIYEPELVIQAYTQFYDQKGGGIEIEFKEDKHKSEAVVALFARNLGQNARNRTPFYAASLHRYLFLSLHTIFYASLPARNFLFNVSLKLCGRNKMLLTQA
jgi:hypothetical protein